MGARAQDPITIRRATVDDLETILHVAGTALGWDPAAPNAELFRWKHRDNPFGASPMWLAESPDGSAVGFRTFLRWRWRDALGATITAVRAVDTATLPTHQGRGIFRRLTLHAVDELTAAGVGFVFNTPNEQSRPGYLAMGWESLGTVPIAVRPRGPTGGARMLRSRVPAAKWSQPTTAGDPAPDVLADPALPSLLDALPRGRDLATDRDAAYLRWRYGLDALHYRALTVSDDVGDGLAIFRMRARGRATEATVCEVLAPSPAVDRRLLGAVLRRSGADYVIRAGHRRGGIPLPRQGPVWTWRALAETSAPALGRWDLSLGDVELL